MAEGDTVSGTKDDSPAAKHARAVNRAFKEQTCEIVAAERERGEAARVAAIDEKTTRLKALRLAREAEAAAAKKVRKP